MIVDALKDRDVVVGTTGMLSRELFEYRVAKGHGHEKDFLTVGSMGHASAIALGIAQFRPKRQVLANTCSILYIALIFTCNKLRGGVLLGIFGGGVLPASPNPDPISDQKMPFPIPISRPGLKNPYPFSDMTLYVIKHSTCISAEWNST